MNKKKILIVDDTPDTVDLLKKRFRAEGYDTAEASDGEECLRKAREYLPDLIVLDVMMPRMNGFEACEKLKHGEHTRYIPVLMLTAKSEVPDKVKGLDTGADDYLTKPFDYKELAARVRTLLAKKEASERLAEEEKSVAIEHIMDELAHEIRNPLVSIGGFARRVYESLPEDDPNKTYMEIILQDVGRLEQMVKQLVELKGAAVSYMEESDINEIISDSLKSFDRVIEERGVTVELSLMPNPPLVPVDRVNLTRALSNIIENAIEAMSGAVRVLRISSQVSGGCFEIRIADTGKGIPRDKIKSIYDPFVTSKLYGPGLGLTITLSIIQNHKGSIVVESEEGAGAAFTISLPLKGPLNRGVAKPQK
jgi:two-component system sensor histidine kinase/response regulator